MHPPTCSFSSSLTNSGLSTSTRVLNCWPTLREKESGQRESHRVRPLCANTLMLNPKVPAVSSRLYREFHTTDPLTLMKVGPSFTRPSRNHTAGTHKIKQQQHTTGGQGTGQAVSACGDSVRASHSLGEGQA
jgi:hypothetical protein